MSNTITEGKERVLAPDADGVVVKIPTSAAIDLTLEVTQASELRNAQRGAESRERSSIESRTDLRIAATNEAMRADPNRTEPALQIAEQTAKAWVDLDAQDFGRIRSETRREFALDAIASHAAVSPEYAKALKERSPSISQAVENINAAREKVEQQLSAENANVLRQQALDAQNLNRQAAIDSASMQNVAAVRASESARVAQELFPPSPASDRSSSLEDRMRSFDWSYTQSDDAKVVSRGAAELSSITKELEALAKAEPKKAAALWNEHAEYHKRPDFLPVEKNVAPVESRPEKVIKRPIDDAELSAGLQARFIVSHEKRGMWDKGTTEFTFRNGQNQGRVAFVDNGKSLTTPAEDRETVRAMLEVATAKNWKEVTLNGTEDFKRNAWLEASLAGLQVRGYEPREADKIMLQELQQDRKPLNSVIAIDRERQNPQAAERVASGRADQVNGDELSPSAKTVIDNSRAFLLSKNVGEKFADATVAELMTKFRTHEGEVIEHGRAPYKFDKNNEPSYFVALKTPNGEQVVWGKGLAEAMQDRRVGEQVILQNIGKKDVTVNEKLRDGSGHVIAVRPKDSQLNEWTAKVVDRVQSQSPVAKAVEGRTPSLRVYDTKAPRQQPAPRREVEQTARRAQDIKPPSRER
jgi:hypothetical protein